MDIDLARTIARAAFRSSRELGALVPVLKEKLAADEYKTYSKAIALSAKRGFAEGVRRRAHARSTRAA